MQGVSSLSGEGDGAAGASWLVLAAGSRVPGDSVDLLEQAFPAGRVHCVSSLADCLREAGTGAFDALILEPGEPALEVLARLAGELPCLFLQPCYDGSEARRVLELGAQDCLGMEGLDAPRLRRCLEHALGRHARERLASMHAEGRDTASGLADRAALNANMDRSIGLADRSASMLGLLVVDVGAVDDIAGSGDLREVQGVLRGIGRRLVESTRRTDLVARMGGGQFAVLLHEIDGDFAASRVAEEILAALEKPLEVDGREHWLGTSIGIALFPRDGQRVETLLSRAGAAGERARHRGRGGYAFHSEAVNAKVRKRVTLEGQLRRAMQRGGLRLAYQPKVSAELGTITGAEALLRWSDPELGDVPPMEFIPVAEETGLIVPLGAWVIREATAQLARWKAAGFHGLRMMVNVSARQIERDDLRETLVSALWESDLDPRDLVLEVTESALLENESRAIESLGELARMGLGIALDDFGTGYSSLSFLKRFPLEWVKIDRSFVQDLAFDPDDAAIVTAILSIARQLDLRVIAEGVETAAQRDFLVRHGCDEIQGFLISPAVSPEAFEAQLRESESGRPFAA